METLQFFMFNAVLYVQSSGNSHYSYFADIILKHFTQPLSNC